MARWWPWRKVEQREALTLEQLLAEDGRPTAAGEPVTTSSAMRLTTVWACVRLLADSVSTLPLDVYRRGEQTPLATLPPLLQHPSADFEELSDWLYAVMASLLLRGNGWGVITARSGAGMLPAQCDLVHPDHMGVTLDRDGRVEHRLLGEKLDSSTVWHVKAYPFPAAPNMPALGLSPIEHARETIGLGLAAERYGGRFFGQDATPPGVITSDQHITSTQAEDLQDRWEQRHTGRRKIAVLGDGGRFQPISIRPDEAQFIETQQFNVSAVARLFGIPGEMVGGQTAGPLAYSSPEMRSLDFLTFALRPWLLRIERAVSRLLPSTQQAKFNAGGFVRTDLKTRYEAHAAGIQAGFLTVNEARALEDLPPLPEGGASA
jgi:HK97 family phage portal protein